jgi:circadian clock protein KaiC
VDGGRGGASIAVIDLGIGTDRCRGRRTALTSERDDIVKTGILGLDAILLGGIPRGNVVILAGPPGTGKTTMGIEFVYRGASDFDEPGLVVTFEVSAAKLVRDAAQFGWNLQELQEQDRLKIISTTRRVFQQEVQEPDSVLLTEAARIGARRIFIDGLAGFVRNGNGEARELFHVLVEALHRESVTAIFALDAPADRAGIGAMPEDFLADTIIRLGLDPVRRAVVRSIEVVKSRGHEYLLGTHSFRIVNGRGTEVYRRAQAAPDDQGDRPVAMDVTRRVSTGTPGLDELLNGGYFVGSTTLVAGISGAGKTVMALQFLTEGARRNEPGLMVTLDEPQDRMIRNAATIGIDLTREIERGMIDVWYQSPQEMEVDRHFAELERRVERQRPRRVVIDSIAGYGAMIGPAVHMKDFLHAVVRLLRNQQITSIFNQENPEMLGMSTMTGGMDISSFIDNILLMNWVELGDTFRLGLTIAKARAMPTSRTTYECEVLDGRGLRVLPRAVPLPALPFARYYGLLSRAPERRTWETGADRP